MVCPRNGGGRLREKARFTSLFTFCAEQKSREEPEQLDAIRGGDKDALAGGKSEHEQLEEKVKTGCGEKHDSMDEADSASKKAAASAKAEFQKALAEAQDDGDVSDEETARIRKAQDAYSLVEGLVDSDRITTSWCAASVEGTGNNRGAFAGYAQTGYITKSYYDSGKTSLLAVNNADYTGITPLTSSEMLHAANFPVFDFDRTWLIDEGATTPYLQTFVVVKRGYDVWLEQTGYPEVNRLKVASLQGAGWLI